MGWETAAHTSTREQHHPKRHAPTYQPQHASCLIPPLTHPPLPPPTRNLLDQQSTDVYPPS
eukprot:364864-Chlamydomonas_euryale.AAC.5